MKGDEDDGNGAGVFDTGHTASCSSSICSKSLALGIETILTLFHDQLFVFN